jgi:SAM-dependent methyltransferase
MIFTLYGADIEQWGNYKKDRKLDFTYKVIQMKPYKIPYDDKMFDCIFLILTLHHAENPLDVLNECNRILKDDGCIVLVEHDVWTDDTHMLVDLEHRIWTTINNEGNEGAIANYYNFYEWNIIFSKCGFKHIHGDILYDDIAYTIRYDMQNVQLYCKKEYKYSNTIYT